MKKGEGGCSEIVGQTTWVGHGTKHGAVLMLVFTTGVLFMRCIFSLGLSLGARVCVCVCVREREIDREIDSQSSRPTLFYYLCLFCS